MELFNYTDGIFIDKSGALDINHIIFVVGWGVENGTKYWLIRISWGYWGIKGFFKLVRGVNNLNIESQCSWAVPVWNPLDFKTNDARNNSNS